MRVGAKWREGYKSDGELYYTIDNGVRLSGMPAFRGMHTAASQGVPQETNLEDDTPVKSSFSPTIQPPIEDVKIDHENGTQQPGLGTILGALD